MHVQVPHEREFVVQLIQADTDTDRAKAAREYWNISAAEAPTIDEIP